MTPKSKCRLFLACKLNPASPAGFLFGIIPHMAKKQTKKKKSGESDSAYFLKLVLFLVLSSLWLHITKNDGTEVPLPLGAVVALVFASHDHFQIDRKIEYALILAGMFIAFWLPVGIFISL